MVLSEIMLGLSLVITARPSHSAKVRLHRFIIIDKVRSTTFHAIVAAGSWANSSGLVGCVPSCPRGEQYSLQLRSPRVS